MTHSSLMPLYLETNLLTIKLKFFTMRIQFWQIKILVSHLQTFSLNFFLVLILRVTICRDYIDIQILNVDSPQEIKFKQQKDNLLNILSVIIEILIKLIVFTVRHRSGNLIVTHLNRQLWMFLWMGKILLEEHHLLLQGN